MFIENDDMIHGWKCACRVKPGLAGESIHRNVISLEQPHVTEDHQTDCTRSRQECSIRLILHPTQRRPYLRRFLLSFGVSLFELDDKLTLLVVHATFFHVEFKSRARLKPHQVLTEFLLKLLHFCRDPSTITFEK